jgi:MFS family permease
VLGFDAFQTGLRLVPMSVMMLIAALTGPRLAARRSPKAVARLGLLSIAAGAVVVLATLDVELNQPGFTLGLALFGVGAGLLASQIGNVIMTAAPPEQTNEAGGLQGTAQNLGASLGTALIGAVLLIGLTTAFANTVENDQALPESLRTELAAAAREQGLEIVTVEEVAILATEAGLPPDQVAAITADYGEAQLAGLRVAFGAVALFAVLGLWFTRHLPARAPAAVAAEGPVPAAVATA